MSYCTTTDVLAIVDTDMTAPEVDVLIDIISAIMNSMIDTGSIDAQLLRGICQAWTAYRVMLKDPNARSLGEYSENRDKALEMLWNQVEIMLPVAQEGGTGFVAARSELG